MAISMTSNSPDPWGILNSSQRKRTIPVQKSAMLSRHPWEIIHKKLGWILPVTSTICWYVGCVLQTSFQNQLQNSEICKNKTRTYIYSVMIQHYLITLVTLTSSPTVLQLPSSQGEVSTVPTPLVSTRVEPKAKPRRFGEVSLCFYRRSWWTWYSFLRLGESWWNLANGSKGSAIL